MKIKFNTQKYCNDMNIIWDEFFESNIGKIDESFETDDYYYFRPIFMDLCEQMVWEYYE